MMKKRSLSAITRSDALIQYILFTILVVLTPFVVVTKYLQGVVQIVSHLSFTLFDVEPKDNDELYLVVKNVIYRKTKLKSAINNSSQRNLHWSRMFNSQLSGNESITAIKVSGSPANRLYYGSDKGKVYRIDDANSGNPSKIEITGSNFPINGYVSCAVTARTVI